MSATRLLVLGAVRVFQPVHGYFLRRELLTWRVDHWAAMNPGSIYNALRSLTKDEFIEEVGTESGRGRPLRTSYRLTPAGDEEFLTLLREALWRVEPFDPKAMLAGLSFMFALPRDEVVAALESRIAQIEAAHKAVPFQVRGLGEDPGKPAHIVEHLLLGDHRMQGELEWTRSALKRIRGGAYAFDKDPSSSLDIAP
jgi:DNA-binding PadR family transcriptional regulator